MNILVHCIFTTIILENIITTLGIQRIMLDANINSMILYNPFPSKEENILWSMLLTHT